MGNNGLKGIVIVGEYGDPMDALLRGFTKGSRVILDQVGLLGKHLHGVGTTGSDDNRPYKLPVIRASDYFARLMPIVGPDVF